MKLPDLVDEDGRALQLGPEIARGGEGAVFRIRSGQSGIAKLYFSDSSKTSFGPPPKEQQSKLKAAIETTNSELRAVAAWPEKTVRLRNGREVFGFLMPDFGDLDKIHLLYRPQDRKQLFPQLTWNSLILIAASLSEAVATIHRHGHVIGDINESNMLVSKSGDVKLIDCDSFQIRCRGQDFPCNVGVELYQPPELQGKSLNGKIRSVEHDSFGLAVMVFTLLFMGRHPFAGVWLDKAEVTIDRAIKEHRFAFSHTASRRNVAPPPIALSLDHVSPELASMFERAFAQPVNGQYSRPSASDWGEALRQFSTQLSTCPKNKFHVVPQHLMSCPWCELLTQKNVDFFPLYPGPKKQLSVADQSRLTAPIVRQPRPLRIPWPAPATWRRISVLFFLCVVAHFVYRWFGGGPSPIPVKPTLPPLDTTLSPVAIEMKLIPVGEFWMGSANTEEDEGPRHRVKLNEPFYIGTYEITQGQYELLMGVNPSFFTKPEPQVRDMDTSRFPVEKVSWFDALEFCNRLSVNHGLAPYYSLTDVVHQADPVTAISNPDGTTTTDEPKNAFTIRAAAVSTTGSHGYRLPTEAEWEYACRAGADTPFSFTTHIPSHDLGSERANVNVRSQPGGSFFSNSLWRSTTVGSYEPNAFGLFDMHGNVGEWCWDWFDEHSYSQFADSTAINPSGPSTGQFRILRGGSWHDLSDVARSTSRAAFKPRFSSYTAGFRVARTADVMITPPIASDSKPALPLVSKTPSKPVVPPEVKPIEPKPAQKEPKPPEVIAAVRDIGIEMKLIEAGEFTMGADSSQAGNNDSERPTHRVKISKHFYIGVYEVTQDQYEKVMGANPSHFSKTGGGSSLVAGLDTNRFPVDSVSWSDAAEFCNKLSMLDNRSPCYRLADAPGNAQFVQGDGYRLPTEAEWEYACRATSGTYAFNTGTRLNGDEANINGTYRYKLTGEVSVLDPERDRRDPKGKFLERTTTVGSYRPNGWGLFDMHGNASEWCSDKYDTRYYSQLAISTAVDPAGSGSSGYGRSLRGGSWNSRPHECRSASRLGISPDVRRNIFGFRLARSL